MSELVPNPYFINVELFWPDGSRPDASQISVVKAFDVNGAVVTEQGQSGYDHGTGGWQPVYMQNIAAFFPPRQRPNLRFDVVSTQGQVLHGTQVFHNISHNSTVRIVIGQSDELVGDTTWRVGGTVRWPDGTAITLGTVRAYDVTNGSEVLLGSTSIGPTGAYVITYEKDQFENNGTPHQNPNLQVRVFDPSGMLLKATEVVLGAAQNQQIDVVLQPPVEPGDYRVFGEVLNEIGLPVKDVLVQAYHVAWTTAGIQELPLGSTLSDEKGAYEIFYLPVTTEDPLTACGSSPSEVNLIAYAKNGTVEEPGATLSKSAPVSPAAKDQRVDLVVDKASSSTLSEYAELENQIGGCLGADPMATINQLALRDDYLIIAARTSGVVPDLLRAYVIARKLTAEINAAVDELGPEAPLGELNPQVLYALVRLGRGHTLTDLLEVQPAAFFESMVEAIEQNIVDRALEEQLDPELDERLQVQWREVLAHYLGVNEDSWQTKLIQLVVADAEVSKRVVRSYFEHQGTFAEFVLDLVATDADVDAEQGKSLVFAFEVFESLNRYFPLTKLLTESRQAQGWETIQDLSKVPLVGEGGTQGWEHYAWYQLYEYPTDPEEEPVVPPDVPEDAVKRFPGDIPGRTAEEKATVYAQRLYDQFGKREPTARFVDEFAQQAQSSSDPDEQAVAQFLADHPDFDLHSTVIDRYLSDNNLEPDEAVVVRLKQLQRVRRLTADFESAVYLVDQELDSAVKISIVEEGQFIADHEETLGLTEAQAIHRKAKNYALEVFSTLVRFNQNLNDTGGALALPGSADLQVALQETSDGSSKFPNWVTLFGSLYNCGSRHCQTVLSPGAYLVDLLDNFLKSPSVRRGLLDRRPDIVDIELTCPNTDKAVPYIDLVNEVLAAAIAPHQVVLLGSAELSVVEQTLDDAAGEDGHAAAESIFSELRAKGYSITDQAVVKHSALNNSNRIPPVKEWIIEDDAWRFTVRLAEVEEGEQTVEKYVAFGAPQTSARGEEQDVFPEHANPDAQALLGAAVFPMNLPLALPREEVELILSQRGTSRAEVLETFRPEVDTSGKLSDPDLALAYLGLTQAEGNTVLTLTDESHPGAPDAKPVYEYWGLKVDEEGRTSVPRPESPTIRVSGPWMTVLSEVSVFLHRARLTYAELLDLVDSEFVHDPAAPLVIDAEEQYLQECDYNRFVLANLTEDVLRRISFFLRLRAKLGWSIRELDRVLMLLGDWVTVDDVEMVAIPENFVRIAQVVRLSRVLNRPATSLLGYWVDLDLRRSGRQPKSLFDEVYLRGATSSDEYQGMDLLAQGETLELSQENILSYKNYVRGALRLGAADMEVLWDAVGPDLPSEPAEATVPLTVAQLSALYRIADFCRSIGLSVQEFFVAKDLLEVDPFPGGQELNLLATFEAVEAIRRLQSSGISARLWKYLLQHDSMGESAGPSAEDVAEARRRMAVAAGEVLERYPDTPTPTAEMVGAGLGEALSADKVGRVLDVLRQPAAGVTAQADFLQKAFGFFAEDSATLVANLAATEDSEERFALVWAPLRPVLVRRAREQAALAVAADVFSARREIVDALLRRALSSVRAGATEEAAWSDWIVGIGGWTSEGGNVEAIVDSGEGEWSSNWVVPADGQYRFIASLRGQGNVTLAVGGDTLVPETPQEVDGRTQVPFPALSLRAGVVVSLSFEYEGSGSVTLLVQKDDGDPSVPAASSLSPFDGLAYMKLWKALTLVRGLKLTTNELEYLISKGAILDEMPLQLPAENPDVLAWSEVSWFIDHLNLSRTISLEKTTLLDVWRTADELTAEQVAELTGWEQQDVEAVQGLWVQPPSFLEPATWLVLRECVRIARRVDLRVSQMLQLVVQGLPTAGHAAALRSALRSKYTTDSWRSAFKPLRDKLRQRERDALIGYLTNGDHEVHGKTRSFVDANDLLFFFLIDPEMEPDTQISRVRLALNSIQLFVERVFMGLESQNALAHLDPMKQRWSWMQSYRVWEANRKVFLFPENWIEPELRDDKTELFKELEEELKQDDVTDERAEQLLYRYVEGLSELSDLLVVGMCAEGRFSGGSTSVYHIVARTRSKPFTYYHRMFQGRQFTDGIFTPWQKIPLEIEADRVVPALSEGSLRIFWPLVTLKEKVATGSGPEALGSTAEIRLLWSTFESKTGRWTKPRLGQTKVHDFNPIPVFNRGPGDDGPDTSFYHYRSFGDPDGTVGVFVYKSQFPTQQDDGLHLKLIGRFSVRASGDEDASVSNQNWELGDNWPTGTALLRNAAVMAPESIATVEGTPVERKFTFRGSLPFFNSAGLGFRSLVTNFGVVSSDNEPFFFETPNHDKTLFALHRGSKPTIGLSSGVTQTASFTTFSHPVLPEIKSRLRAGGPAAIMERLVQALPSARVRYYYNYSKSQLSSSAGSYTSGYNNKYSYYSTLYLGYHIAGDAQAWGVTQREFEKALRPTEAVQRPFPLPTVDFEYGTACGVYNWELFFHLPMLIADRLSQEMRFEDAMKWYHYVFDPRRDRNLFEKSKRWVDRLPAGAKYWNFLPFFANRDATDSLLDVFGVRESLSDQDRRALAKVIDAWRSNPFSPHLIARQRIVAYQKSVVMKYLDNLLAWGDQLFRRDTFESINQATQVYVLAAEILGKRPEVIEPLTSEPRYTYRELQARGISDFANAFVEVENLMVATSQHVNGEEADAPPPEGEAPQSTALLSLYFRIPRNDRLDGYWDTVQDRLFKIRNSMNIDGVKRTLALFEPPIDPAMLVRAAAAGLDLGSVLSDMNRPLPFYRFNVWMQKAMDLVNELKSFGGALLSALEKGDAEELALLRQNQELRMLRLVKQVREEQVREAEQNIEALTASRKLAEDRFNDYSGREFMNSSEKTAMALTVSSGAFETQAGVANTTAGVLGAIPQTSAGAFSAAVEFGGQHLNSIFQAIGAFFQTNASVTRTMASMAGTLAGYERRQEDWDLQIRQAQLEMANIDQQLIAAEIRAEIARKELANQEVQIEQSEEVREFLQSKFTNRELYQWMVTQLSRTYQQIYKLTYDVAKTAERTFQFELGIPDTSFVQFGYMDSLRQGLLAGEKLAYDLKRMDVAYLEKNKRELEITKQISLAAIDPKALQELRETGACQFSLPEVLFDLDFPGQYFRRIRAVRLTVPCVTGPYTSVSAKLSLLGSAIRVASTAEANEADYPYRGFEDSRFVHDVGGIQSIATSTGQDDSGLFELNFRDERYLPFEGAGAISKWRVELPQESRQFDYHTISDVVMTISYTARDAGGSLKKGAEASLTRQLNSLLSLIAEEQRGLVRVISMKREFPTVLHQLLSDESQPTTLRLLPEHFPFLLREKGYELVPWQGEDKIHVRVVPRGGGVSAAAISLAVNDGDPSASVGLGPENGVLAGDLRRPVEPFLENWGPEDWTLTQTGLSPENVDDVLFVVKYTLEGGN